jgi:hypothetical protein
VHVVDEPGGQEVADDGGAAADANVQAAAEDLVRLPPVEVIMMASGVMTPEPWAAEAFQPRPLMRLCAGWR